ncbi:hypothetical protein DU475_19355 [Rhodopseudomonas sp. WA056]|nr:hypothetical protein [Rhodopseudomonas sp. WA056]
MHLRAPDDKKGTKARLNWLLRQFPASTNENWHIRLYWPGRTSSTQRPLASLRENIDQAVDERPGQVVTSFDVIMVRDIGARFAQRRNFILELESIVPLAYDQAGQHLRAWQRTAPRLSEAKAEPASVNTEAMRDAAEQELTGQQERLVAAPAVPPMPEPGGGTVQSDVSDAPAPDEAAISNASGAGEQAL